ncbi:MAG TPA: DUF935 domain-containing protein [Cellvibrio sp.]|nr:DUF935 domain-containing protein [Cellvibrio sp.]
MLVDLQGNPLKREALGEPQTAKLGSLHREFAGHPAKGLTPAKLAGLLVEAEQGDLTRQAELFMDIEERDAHIFSDMSKRKRAVMIPSYEVVPARNAGSEEKKDAEYLNEVLHDIDGMEDLFFDCMDGVGHGFAAIEIDGWQRLGTDFMPKAFVHRPQSWFQLAQENQNELRLRGPGGGEELRPLNWIMHRPRARSGYVARTGLFRVLVWPYLFKHYAVSDLAEMLEIYGLPLRIGKYPSGAGDAEKATLLRAVMALGHSAAGIIPSSMAIEFEKASEGTSEPFLAMTRWAEEACSKAILGGTLTSSTSASGGGAHALGEVHNEVRKDLRDGDCKQLANTLTRDLLWPMLVLSKGNRDPRRAPRLQFDLREPEDLEKFTKSIPVLVDLGMEIPKGWSHEKTGIPKPVDGEEILARAKPQPQPEAELLDRKKQRVALSRILAPAFKDQQQLDEALENIPAADLQNASLAILTPVLDAINSGASESELLGMLNEILPGMDESVLAEALHKMMFAADAWGRLFATAERVG